MDSYRFSLSLVLLATLGGCDAGPEGAALRSSETTAASASQAPTLALPSVTDEPSATSWQAWVAAEVIRLRDERPEFYTVVMEKQATRTRAGFGRMIAPELRDADAAPLLISRLASGAPAENSYTRAALVDALHRTNGRYSEAVADLLIAEPDARVRTVLIESLRWADPKAAHRGLSAGLHDASLEVRTAAARTVGNRKDGAILAPELIATLSDSDPNLRAIASRSLGILRVDKAKVPLSTLLADDALEVRLHSLRALSRIDRGYAATLPSVSSLQNSDDPRIARVASTIMLPEDKH